MQSDLLAANMLASASVPVFAEGSALPGTTQETVTNPDGTTTEITTTTTVKPGESSGTTDVTIVIDKTTEGTTTDGVEVNGNDHREEHKTVDSTKDNLVTDSSMSEYGSETRTEENGREVTTGYAGGSEMSTKENGIDNVTVEVPLGGKDNVNSATGRPAGTVISVTNNLQNSKDDGSYEYTSEKVARPAIVTVTSNGISIIENVGMENTDLEYVYNETKPSNGEAENDLVIWIFRGNRTEFPTSVEDIDLADGYAYKYIGSGLTSQFFPVYLYTSPGKDDPNEEPFIMDGKKYYFRGQGQAAYDNMYVDGQKVMTDKTYQATFAVPQQFILVDGATGELITTYCADIDTATEKGFNYNIENLEDADYYNEEQAAMIRTIAANGYWGTVGTEIDKDGNEVPVQGSLAAMRKMLLESGKFTEEELKYLTDGVALSATQMAIWNFSSQMNVEYRTAIRSNEGNSKGELSTTWASQLVAKNMTEEHDKGAQLMYKLYDFLISMEPTPAGAKNGSLTTANTIINADHFINGMDITVIEKAKDHANNLDNIDTNDAYVTDITFSLVVAPAANNNDDLVVKVIGYDENGNEYVVASGRIAGTNDADESYETLVCDINGNYKFENIVLTEGNKTFNITLEGIQNLEKGVYLYTSEVRTAEDGSETSSQTLVGLAEGSRAVNVEMSIDFSLSVEDEIIATEHVWHTEWIDDPQPPKKPETPEEEPQEPEEEPKEPKKPEEKPEEPKEDPKEEPEVPAEDPKEEPEVTAEIEDEEIPLVRIPEDAIPLTDIPDEPVPQTGDNMFWYISTVAAAAGVFLLNLLGKKEKKNHNA